MSVNRSGVRREVRVLLVGLVIMATLFTADVVSSLFFRTDTAMSAVRSGPEGGAAHTLLVFPGYGGDCQSISEAFRPHLDSDWTLAVLCYAERGIDDDQVFSLLRADVETAPKGSVSILAGSMGGMVAVNFLDRMARSDTNTLPEVRLILDTSPPDSSFVKRPELLLRLTHWYRGGALTSLLWLLANSSPDHSALEPNASLQAVERGDRYFREIGMPALTSQAQYIDNFRLDDASTFQDIVRSAVFIEAAQSEKDPLVEVKPSIETWRLRLPQLEIVEMTSRRGDWHIPWTQRPKEVLSVVLNTRQLTS